MANPKFYELQRLRKSTWDTPRFVRGYDLTVDDRLTLPRGLRHAVEGIVERAGSRLAIVDVRTPGREIDVTCTAELDATQSTAVGALLAHDDGVLVAPPGSGKTVMACAVIAERAAATLVLVDRKALAEQWRARIEQFLGIKTGAGRWRPAQAQRGSMPPSEGTPGGTFGRRSGDPSHRSHVANAAPGTPWGMLVAEVGAHGDGSGPAQGCADPFEACAGAARRGDRNDRERRGLPAGPHPVGRRFQRR
ncbi:DEAD/DEAH box helicase family protein [Dactylosporangium sp. NPDC049140]|uniref:DEAD/DEAH box helicase family protein n=1 Tax=Dactylosporangium sp. NPDC049140 TaxID=3155647 RepID=UPI0033FDF889